MTGVQTCALPISKNLFLTPERTIKRKVHEAFLALWIEARDVMASGVRARHPTWTPDQVTEQVRELMRDAGA